MLFRCKRCLYPNTKPDLFFEDGVCSACIAFDKRKTVDWPERKIEFLETIEFNPGSTHDVIVACSGGKDSTWQVVKCLELGLRPLAITATTDHLSSFGRANLDNIGNLCDLIEVTPNKKTRQQISRFALQEVGDISWCEHHLIWSVPAREAVARKIPIVLYGECPQNEYGAGPQGSDASHMTKDWVDEFGGLLGLRLSDITESLDISPRQLDLYRYPEGNVRALFMGHYFPWDGRENAEIAKQNGFTVLDWRVEGSCVNYENLDNHQTGIHDYLRWLKFGYGRTCDIASNHIRRGYMTREAGTKLCLMRDGNWPSKYLGLPLANILATIKMSEGEFEKVCNRFTNQEVVAWASRPESFRFYCGTSTDASREKDLIQAAG